MDVELLGALAEPTRLEIVELLREHPRSVGEVAATLGLRQPQATKHLQALERAGLVTGHALGKRRIYALEREPLRELQAWLAELDADSSSDRVLEQYRAAVESEQRQAVEDPDWAVGRRIRLQRTLPAPPAAVWAYWTSPDLLRRWWSPEHFTVADLELEPSPGGRLRVVLQEADGTRHVAEGRFVSLDPPHALRFELGPLGAGGKQLFSASHRVAFADWGGGTRLSFAIRVTSATPAAAPAIAGMQPGWRQTLSKLRRELDG